MKISTFLKAVAIGFITISIFSATTYAQYCTPAPTLGCFSGDYPSAFSMTGTSMSINDPTLTCSTVSSPFGGYEDRTAETCAVVSPSTVNCNITSNTASTYSSYTTFSPTSGGGSTSTVHGPRTESCQIWVDWDNNGVFGNVANEVIGGMEPLPNSPVAFTVTIPSGIATGYYRMRLVLSSGGTYPNMDPCMVTTIIPPLTVPYSTGDAIDYTIYVGPTCPTPVVTLGAATCTSQIVNWTAATGATGYEYVTSTSATPPTGPGTATTALTYTATGLVTGTTYYAYVRTNCGGGSFSSWSSTQFTVGPAAITGTAATCPGSTTQLSDATPSGVWSSSNTGVATVSVSGRVTGVTVGNVTISYTAGGCTTTLAVTVGNLPAIVGTLNVCPGSTTQLSDAVPGGTWSSSNGGVATIANTGLVYGTIAGNTVITYSGNGCTTTATVTVSPLPAITGGNTVCVGSTLALSDATSGGVWSTSNSNASISVSGVVTGAATGSVNVSYTLGGCAVGLVVNVGNAISAITGTTTFCNTSSTNLSDATPGGAWSSSNNSVATVSGSVVVHGVTAGTATISYTLGGCSVTSVVTLDANSAGTISGKDSICLGAIHAVTLSDNVGGGVWSSSNTTRATVNPGTGVVTSVINGATTATIDYVVSNTCGTYTATYVMHLRTASQCATGVNTVPEQQGTQLNVFPNPNGGLFTMNLSSDLNEEVQVVITNLVGEKVKEFKTTTNNTVDIKLNTSDGIYFLSATTGHGKYVTKVVVTR